MANGNDPANIPYIIVENGFYYVAYKEKVKVPEVVVSAKGVANGLSEEYNDGWDFGPDSYDPTSTANPPYTQTTGIGEALQYAINNPTYGSGGNYWIPEVHFMGGYFFISKPIVLNIPYRIMNLTLKGVDTMSPYIGCAFNTTSSDEYPYAININSSDLSNITYIAIQWEHLQPAVTGGYSPYGFANFDFSSVNTGQNTFIGYDLNVSNSGFTSAFNLLGFQQIHMYDFENYGSGNNFNAGFIDFHGGYQSGGYIGVSGGIILSFGMGIHQPVPSGDTTYMAIFGSAAVGVGIYNPNITQTFTIGTLFYGYGRANATSFYNTASSGTITINTVIIRDITASGLTANTAFMGSNGASTSVGVWDIEGVYSDNEYVWTGIPYNSPTLPANPPASATVYQNTNPYDIEIDLPVYATTAATAGYVTVAKGATSTPTAIGNQYVSGSTSDTSEQIIRLRVPAGWYYSFTASGVTFGTASVFAD
jgi:hypothetical protein